MRRIVVGIDGSAHARRALQFAVEEARAHGADLDVVHAWHVEVTAWMFPPEYSLTPIPQEDLAAHAAQRLEKEIAQVVPDEAGLTINRIVANGLAPHVLADAAQGADLLVVGARGMGAFKGMLLGSVSHFLIKHAPCPLVIVRAEPTIVEVEPDEAFVAIT